VWGSPAGGATTRSRDDLTESAFVDEESVYRRPAVNERATSPAGEPKATSNISSRTEDEVKVRGNRVNTSVRSKPRGVVPGCAIGGRDSRAVRQPTAIHLIGFVLGAFVSVINSEDTCTDGSARVHDSPFVELDALPPHRKRQGGS